MIEKTLCDIAELLQVRTEAISMTYYQGDDDDPSGWVIQVPAKKTKAGVTVRRSLLVRSGNGLLESALESARKEAEGCWV